MQIISSSEQQTFELGEKIAEQLKGGDILMLEGDLGAGKTVFAKGVLHYFGIEHVASPTFTLIQVYDPKKEKNTITAIAHIDTYRALNQAELKAMGIEEYLGEKNTLSIIEWPRKIQDMLKNKSVKIIQIEHYRNQRRITIQQTRPRRLNHEL